jgi:hypothetical protein
VSERCNYYSSSAQQQCSHDEGHPGPHWFAFEPLCSSCDQLRADRDGLSLESLAKEMRLAEVTADRDRLAVALDDALKANVGSDNTSLADLMRSRYGREARQWQANHEERKKERDSLSTKLTAVEAMLDEALAQRDSALAEVEALRGESVPLYREIETYRSLLRCIVAYADDDRLSEMKFYLENAPELRREGDRQGLYLRVAIDRALSPATPRGKGGADE